MRKSKWKRDDNWDKKEWIQYFCDSCNTFIGEELEGTQAQYDLSKRCQGQNIGQQECESCRKSREHGYDLWVTSYTYGDDDEPY